jgi:cell division protein FtsN
VITVTFLLGYLTASLFDIQKISQWVNTQVLAHHEVKKEVKAEEQQAAIPPKPKFEFYTLLANEKVPNSQSATNTTQPAASASNSTPAPTNIPAVTSIKTAPVSTVNTASAVTTTVKPNGVKAPQQSNVADKKPGSRSPVAAVSTVTGKGNFLVQVASFKARQDAEQMKGRLILKGFNVYIIPVSHPTKGNWFRVVVGPFGNRGLAQQAQVNLAKNERLNGMITTGG